MAALLYRYDLGNRRRFTKVLLFHSYAPTAAAYKLHRRQFVLTNVSMIRLSRAAETAFGFIAARIA
ncbi:MAG: hypothetical protein KAS40_02760 [Desulfobacterales bacterium]|nr:hypothetical protein [Desulfobacterales bacterium]